MANTSNSKGKMVFLVVVLIIVTILLVRQYLPMVQIPTNGRIAEEEQVLQSKVNDLAVQKHTTAEWQHELAQLRKKSTGFWVRVRTGMPVESEVLEEFNNVARLASVNIQSREPRLVKVPNATYIQEVEIRIELRGVTMREFSRLLRELSRNRRKFHWVSCRIDPDNVQKPTAVRVTGRLRAYVLTEEGTKLLGSAAEEPQEKSENNRSVPAVKTAAPAAVPRAAGRHTARGRHNK